MTPCAARDYYYYFKMTEKGESKTFQINLYYFTYRNKSSGIWKNHVWNLLEV